MQSLFYGASEHASKTPDVLVGIRQADQLLGITISLIARINRREEDSWKYGDSI